MYSELLDFL